MTIRVNKVNGDWFAYCDIRVLGPYKHARSAWRAARRHEEEAHERERLLSQLDARGRNLIENILAQHPELTAEEAIEHAREMGGL